MPYIEKKDRTTETLKWPVGPGQLNYAITELILGYLPRHPSYKDFNEVIGVLECAKLELYRRMVVPYEIKKQGENGDVYP